MRKCLSCGVYYYTFVELSNKVRSSFLFYFLSFVEFFERQHYIFKKLFFFCLNYLSKHGNKTRKNNVNTFSFFKFIARNKINKNMSNPTENDGKQPVEAEDLYSIKISMNVKEVVKEVSAHKGRTIMIALDGTEYSEKAAKWVHDNLAKKEDFIVL
ncbi:hypothetical protein RFI_31288, partial [Reticulomyxa filosa]